MGAQLDHGIFERPQLLDRVCPGGRGWRTQEVLETGDAGGTAHCPEPCREGRADGNQEIANSAPMSWCARAGDLSVGPRQSTMKLTEGCGAMPVRPARRRRRGSCPPTRTGSRPGRSGSETDRVARETARLARRVFLSVMARLSVRVDPSLTTSPYFWVSGDRGHGASWLRAENQGASCRPDSGMSAPGSDGLGPHPDLPASGRPDTGP